MTRPLVRSTVCTPHGNAGPHQAVAVTERAAAMPVIYIASSAFSGSTLLAFALNTHSQITTAGHTTGWSGLTPDFPCSCGSRLAACPFFAHIANAFATAGIAFPMSGHFPTRYRISRRERANQLVFDNLPLLHSEMLERARDAVVTGTPGIRRHIARADRANLIFMDAARGYAGARVYVDNSHSPYRFRRLASIPGLMLRPVHLVRDVRGVSLSSSEVYGRDPVDAARTWIREQETVVRVLRATRADDGRPAYDRAVLLHYERFCDDPVSELGRITDVLDVAPFETLPDFKQAEHHILGNNMRFGSGRIVKSRRWARDLSPSTQTRIIDTVRAFARRSRFRRELEDILTPMLEA